MRTRYDPARKKFIVEKFPSLSVETINLGTSVKGTKTCTATLARGRDVVASVTLPVITAALSSSKSIPVVVEPDVTAMGVPMETGLQFIPQVRLL